EEDEEDGADVRTAGSGAEGRSPAGSGARGMAVLRRFLETKGTDFSNEPEFLPYYALPFARWPARLRAQLRGFLHEHCWGPSVAPELLRLLLVSGGGEGGSEGGG
ncbi:LisH domain-containing protein ARMC9, partial [Gryllus bimaculatus]